jgi:hypothetical protein
MVRRFLLVQALLLWQGGFLFYAAVVVPVGTDVFGSAAQGAVTRRVTWWLNLFGLAFLAVYAWDAYAARDPSRRRAAARWWLGAASAGLLYLLWFLHRLLDYFLAPGGEVVQMRQPFKIVHILYLWASTVHWLLGLAQAWLTLAAWRAEDKSNGPLMTQTPAQIDADKKQD